MKILSNIPIFETKPYRANVMHLNANCNVSHLAEYLFADFASLTINRKFDNCNDENIRNIAVLSTNVNMLLQNGFSEIQNAILDANQERESMCKRCHQIITEKYDFKLHLLVDYSIFTDKKYAASIGIDKKNCNIRLCTKNFRIQQAAIYHRRYSILPPIRN